MSNMQSEPCLSNTAPPMQRDDGMVLIQKTGFKLSLNVRPLDIGLRSVWKISEDIALYIQFQKTFRLTRRQGSRWCCERSQGQVGGSTSRIVYELGRTIAFETTIGK